MITLHLVLLATSVIVALAFIVARFGKTPRPASALVNAIVPMVVVGVLCSLVLNANGTPKAEWIIPSLAIIAVGLFCRSEKLFQTMKWGMLVLSVALCVNFLNIVQSGGYTAAPSLAGKLKEKVALQEAKSAFKKSHEPTEVLSEGPVGTVKIVEVTKEWHTPITRIHKVNPIEATLWYPGGPVSEAADKLTVQK